MSIVAFIMGIGFLGASGALGQPAAGHGARRGPAARLYNPATAETAIGVVQRIERVQGKGHARGHGIHLLLKTEKEEIAVRLGPAWYLDKQPLKIAARDQIEVRGSRITADGKPAIIAAEVKKGDQVLKLRDDAGVPVWRGQGRRRP